MSHDIYQDILVDDKELRKLCKVKAPNGAVISGGVKRRSTRRRKDIIAADGRKYNQEATKCK